MEVQKNTSLRGTSLPDHAKKGYIMSFGTNLQFLRKKKEMTQEELAEKMEVSRQTVSKWESDGAFPETEKTIALCELFGCTMDALLRDDLVREYTEADASYDTHMNRFSLAVAGGVGLILFGLVVMFLMGALGLHEIFMTIALLFFVAIAVFIFIFAGITHSDFVKEHPYIGKIYDRAEVKRYNRLFPILLGASVMGILFGVIFLIASEGIAMPEGFTEERWESLLTMIFFILITISVTVIVWAGLQKSKYDIDDYNKTADKENGEDKENSLSGKIGGVIMLLATVIYLVIGFVWNLWHPGWIVFLIGGILCGITEIIFPDKKN